MPGIPGGTKYPIQPLAALMGGRAGLARLFDSGELSRAWNLGIGAVAADRWAVRCGMDPYQVWPEMLDEAIDGLRVDCTNPVCTTRFHPTNNRHYYCTTACAARARRAAAPKPKIRCACANPACTETFIKNGRQRYCTKPCRYRHRWAQISSGAYAPQPHQHEHEEEAAA